MFASSKNSSEEKEQVRKQVREYLKAALSVEIQPEAKENKLTGHVICKKEEELYLVFPSLKDKLDIIILIGKEILPLTKEEACKAYQIFRRPTGETYYGEKEIIVHKHEEFPGLKISPCNPQNMLNNLKQQFLTPPAPAAAQSFS